MEEIQRRCANCGLQPISKFRKYVAYRYKGKDIYQYKCVACVKQASSNRYKKDPEKSRISLREWREKNPEKSKQIQRDYLNNNPDKRKLYRNRGKERRKKHRQIVLEHYGGIPPVCACCKENKMEFLVIDHENGGGNAHRKKLGRKTERFFIWLIENKFPNGFRVLCHNCNFAISAYGECPHSE